MWHSIISVKLVMFNRNLSLWYANIINKWREILNYHSFMLNLLSKASIIRFALQIAGKRKISCEQYSNVNHLFDSDSKTFIVSTFLTESNKLFANFETWEMHRSLQQKKLKFHSKTDTVLVLRFSLAIALFLAFCVSSFAALRIKWDNSY